jgi:serine/threonine protein kinase
VQDSKSTLFLVLELVTGSELFDRIQVREAHGAIPLAAPSSHRKRCATTQTGCGTSEDTARRYFWQLLSGVGYCHCNGVCHRSSRRTRGFALMLRCFDAHTLRRDLKPENLLLSDGSESAVLKVRRANARVCEDHTCDLSMRARRLLTSGSLRRLRLPPAVTTTRKQAPSLRTRRAFAV